MLVHSRERTFEQLGMFVGRTMFQLKLADGDTGVDNVSATFAAA